MRRCKVNNHAAGFHGLDHVFGDQYRRSAARDQCRGDDHIGLRHTFGDLGFLPLEPAWRHRFGIAADTHSGLTLLVGLVRHINEFAAQRLDLLFHAGAHVAGFDHCTEPLRGGNGLQAGHTDSKDYHARGLDGAGCCHQHREKALVFFSRHHHSLVAGNVGLR